MANVVCEISVTQEPLAARASDVAGAGAIVDFWGVVRPIEDGREIEGIDYDAHREMAEHQLKRIAEQAAERFGLKLVIVHHRIGFIAVGESSLFLQSGESASERRLSSKSMDCRRVEKESADLETAAV